jgi:hypothetical protein
MAYKTISEDEKVQIIAWASGKGKMPRYITLQRALRIIASLLLQQGEGLGEG